MIGVSYDNPFFDTGYSYFQTPNRVGKNCMKNGFKAKMSNEEHYIKAVPDGSWNTCAEVDKIPSNYKLKSGKAFGWCWHELGAEYRFFHAAESTDENPVVVVRGVNEYGKYFEEKIDVRNINPYNTTVLEIEALANFKSGDCKGISYNFGAEPQQIQERFDYVTRILERIEICKELHFEEEAARDKQDMDFVLSFTGNSGRPCRNVATGNRRNLELYSRAARERMVAGMAKRCQRDFTDEFWKK